MEINLRAPSKATKTIVINAPVEKIWHFVTNVNNWSTWNPEVKKANLTGDFIVGAVFKWKTGVSIVSTVREVKHHEKIAWTGKAIGTNAIHTWSFKETENGVEVTTSESFEGWLVWMMPAYMTNMLNDTLTKLLDALKIAAEQ